MCRMSSNGAITVTMVLTFLAAQQHTVVTLALACLVASTRESKYPHKAGLNNPTILQGNHGLAGPFSCCMGSSTVGQRGFDRVKRSPLTSAYVNFALLTKWLGLCLLTPDRSTSSRMEYYINGLLYIPYGTRNLNYWTSSACSDPSSDPVQKTTACSVTWELPVYMRMHIHNSYVWTSTETGLH